MREIVSIRISTTHFNKYYLDYISVVMFYMLLQQEFDHFCRTVLTTLFKHRTFVSQFIISDLHVCEYHEINGAYALMHDAFNHYSGVGGER